ncbi:putative quinol monooxygenase [Flavobacterium sp.]|uniref:putative quinol monooxygenase n=1 Tax=Flavobacterium sp. TaxID=239 RepID=UPI0012017DA5|nr:putative quinol monooxygenase [Flavobacterium sp.]RZJ70598.1 MAG: antibiotic biosynthesis monooxygenase [Flavobacterium sp.]
METEVLVKWKTKPDETQKVLELLEVAAQKSKLEPGNLLYESFQSEDDSTVIFLHERYADKTALEAHKNSQHYLEIVAGKILPLLEIREVIPVKKLF